MSIVATDNKHYSDIADKLREKTGTDTTYKPSEMSEEIDAVYTAGQKSMVDESKLLPTTVSGSYISVDDVSEIPHSVGCKVESANLWRGLSEYTIVGNGTLQKTYQQPITLSGSMSFSCEITGENLEYTANGNFVYLLVTYEDESGDIFTLCSDKIMGSNIKRQSQFNVNGAKVIKFLSIIVPNRFTGGTVTVSNIMVNKGTEALPYTPRISPGSVSVTKYGTDENEGYQTLIPNAGGTVEGITSVSPYMNIFADKAGAIFEITYNKSWGMQEERERFYNTFRQGVINHSISFEWLELDKANTTSIINALSGTASSQTVTFKKSAKEAAFTDSEWAELIATKPNWTFALV